MVLGCSSGIEPNFSYSQQKLVNGEYIDVKMPITKRAASKRVLVSAHDIPWQERIEIQAIAQKYTDGSISSTINLPASTTPKTISEIYEAAWKAGLKGVTVYRYGSKDANAIKIKEEKKERGILDGKTIKVPLESSWYITVNFADGLPKELFINAGKSGSDTKAWTEALGRLGSLYLQTGGKAEKLINALQDIKGQKTIFKNGWSVQSGPDAIAQAIAAILSVDSMLECPECEKLTFRFSEGCGICESCGYEKC
jgi:ribonucleoside-diphosphate reductase alpha chain